MIRSLLRDLSLAVPAVPIILNGWKKFLSQLFGRFLDFYSDKNGKEKLLFILALLQLFFSLTSWINYSIDLGVESSSDMVSKIANLLGLGHDSNGKEEVNMRVAINIFFILPCFLTFFFGGFWRSLWVSKTILSLQGISGLLFLLGVLFPDIFFVSFLKEEDYVYNLNFYAFFTTWSLTTLVVLSSGNSKT
ncbi:hypothetical protein EHO59_00395 [Leptospira semungkisensis]|uniref:Uncharacterized protein n=1 Tax=Leptospira semungkisensis TaxID=2484985 RepID=A0A4R9G524_9LEPT|nr:hypothetical protein [Leptospira semungkisensis]TGK06638.1 hypothetical protein EHO59_00395 [Leptospira semungkisensis]